MKKTKNYGLVIKKKDPRDFVLGGVFSLPKVVIQPDGQWDAYLAREEAQSIPFETYNCTGYATNAVFETLFNRLNAGIGDRSDRFLGIRAKTKPPGNDPHVVAKAAKNNGVIAEETLPFSNLNNINEYFSFKGGEEWKCDLEGQDFLKNYSIGYEDVWQGKISVSEKQYRIKEALIYSPLTLSIYAFKEKDGVYVSDGNKNNDLVMAYGWTDRGIKVLSTYAPFKKIIAWEHNNQVCIRYHLEKQATKEEIGIFMKILQAISNWLSDWQKEQDATVPKVEPKTPVIAPQAPTKPIGSKLISWAAAIRDYEGQPGDLSYKNNNPGNLKGLSGKFLKFQTWDEGWKVLIGYLTRAATGKHKAYKPDFNLLQFFSVYAPATDKNNPKAYASFVAKKIGVGMDEKIKNLV